MPKFSDVNPTDHTSACNNLDRAAAGLYTLVTAQSIFSFAMFGNPNVRGPAAILDHVRKEVEEIAGDPMNRQEWADLVILALDGLHRACHLRNQRIPKGGTVSGQTAPEVIIEKIRRNFARDWPALSEQDPTRAVEHVRSDAELAEKVIELAQAPIGTPHPCTRPHQLQSPVSNGTQAELNMWAQALRDLVPSYGFQNVDQLLVAAGLIGPAAPRGYDLQKCVEGVMSHFGLQDSDDLVTAIQAHKDGSRAAHREAYQQALLLNATVQLAGYDNLQHFALSALANLGHIVPNEGIDQ